VWVDRCVRVFLCAFNHEFLVERLDRCGRVMEGAVDGLLSVMVFLVSIATTHVYLQYMEVCVAVLAAW
jgi:hypothetical protein